MAVSAHFFDKFQLNHLKSGQANLASDTLKVGLIASGTFNWVNATQAYEFVSDFLTNSGSGGGGALTEVTGGSYARATLSGVSYTQSNNVATLTCSTVVFSTVTFTASYAFFYDETNSSATDATRPLICYWDFGGAQSVSGANFNLSINASGLVTWTAN